MIVYKNQKLFSTSIISRVFSEKSEMVVKLPKKKKQDKNDIERAGKIVTKAGVVTAGLGAASALGGSKLVSISAKKAAEAATDNALRKSLAAGAVGGAAVGAGAKATKAGLGLAAIGVGTKIVGRRVRKQREKEATKKEEKK